MENKKKTATFWGWKFFKNENAEPHQILTGSFKNWYLNMIKNILFDVFENLIVHTLHKLAPTNQKHIKSNRSTFMNKNTHNAIRIQEN